MSNVLAMDPKTIIPWYPKIDRKLPVEERLTILHHVLDMHQDAELSDEQLVSRQKGKESKSNYYMNKADVKRLELSITGFKNLSFPKDYPDTMLAGKPCPFSIENITCIPIAIRKEYVEYLTGRDKEDTEETSLGEATPA